MIGQITGTLLMKQPPLLMIDVQGIGYEITAPMSTFYQLPNLSESVTLITHLLIREDHHTLYGFSSQAERALFRAFIKINGVGPRLAVSLLSGIDIPTLVQAVQTHNTAPLVAIPGIGQKTAERLVLDLKDRLKKMTALQSYQDAHPTLLPEQDILIVDATNALVALGYKTADAKKWVEKTCQHDMLLEDLIKQALQQATGA